MKSIFYLNAVLTGVVCVGIWLLPTYMTAPILHSPFFRSLFSIFDSDTRIIITSNRYPWRSVGIVHSDFDARVNLCTGFLVSPKRVMTSAHCVLNEKGSLRNPLYFRTQSHTSWAATSYIAYNVRLPFELPFSEKKVPIALDIATFELGRTIGVQLGYFSILANDGIRSGKPGALPQDKLEDNRPCSGTVYGLPWYVENNKDNDSIASSPDWWSPDWNTSTNICVVGYSGEIGYAKLSASSDCGILGKTEGIIVHSCVISEGASGGPLFYFDRDGAPIVFALNTGIVPAEGKFEGLDLKTLYVATQIDSHTALMELTE